jgi:mRNA interferase MazF
MRNQVPDAGDVIWIQFPGAVATKRRPAVILSSNEYHAARPDIIVGLVTSQVAKATTPTDHSLADWNAAGLQSASAFRAYLATLPKSAIISRVGRLSAVDWQAVKECVKRAIALA